MTVKIVQTCNSCQKERELKFGYYGLLDSLQSSAEGDGWVTFKRFKHFCPDCMKKLLAGKTTP